MHHRKNVTLEIPARRGQLRRVRAFAVECCAGHRVSSAVLAEVQLGLTEAASNVIAHAYAGRPPGRLRIEASWHGNEVRFAITDTGCAFTPDRVRLPAIAAGDEDGLGVYLLHQSMDRVRYRRTNGRNRLELVKILRSLA